MKIKMTTVLKSLTGEPLEEMERYDNSAFISTEETPDEKPQHFRKKKIILRDICINAFATVIDSDKGVSGVDKNKWFLLSLRIQKENEIDFSSEEISLLKKRIGKIYTTLIVGRAYEILDPVSKTKSK